MSNFPNDYNPQDFPNNAAMPYQGNPWQEQQDLQKKKSGCGCWFWGCGCGCLLPIILLIVCGIAGYYVCVKGVPMPVSVETTVITEPLKKSGNGVDFFAVIEKEYVPLAAPEENGFKEVLAAYGKAMFDNPLGKREWQYEETCRKLDLNPAAESTAVWEDYSEYFTGNAEDASKLASTPWKIGDQPKMKDWFDKVNGGLDVLRNAVMKKHYFLPMVRRNDNELAFLAVSTDALNFHRQLAESLRVRAMQKLGAGQSAEAWKDITAALRLERFVFTLFDMSEFEDNLETQIAEPQQGNISPEELASMFESNFSALFVGRNILLDTLVNYSNWKKEELDRSIADLESLPPWLERLTYLKMLQFTVLDTIFSMNDTAAFSESLALDSHPKGWVKGGTTPFMNWGIIAKQLNIKFADYTKNIKPEDTQTIVIKTDKEILEELHRKLKTSVERFYNNPASLMAVNSRSALAGDTLGDVLTASDLIVFKQELNCEQERQLLRAAFAVKRFQLEKNELPKTLEDLKLKPLIPELPLKLETTAEGISLTCGSQSILLKSILLKK